MTVKELIKLLQKQNPDKQVAWYHTYINDDYVEVTEVLPVSNVASVEHEDKDEKFGKHQDGNVVIRNILVLVG